VAIVPAAVVTIYYGESGTAKLLIFSQVVLSLQPPFAIVPLIMVTSSKAKMGKLIAPRSLTAVAGTIAAVIILLNVKLILDAVAGS
jgi:manganese transport protein